MTEPLLKVSNLTKQFPTAKTGPFTAGPVVQAVDNISFDLAPGEALGLVGESGCGKSTTGRSVLRLVEPRAGQVLFDGDDVGALDKEGLRRARQNMQMIFQDPFASLNPRKSVGAAIAEPIIVHGLAVAEEARERVAELLRRVGLSPDMADRYPHEFSGGQRQRLCIARALALKPKLIVADEAVSALDVSIKAQVVNLMMELQAEMGLAYLFISHDMAVVERVSHRVAVMYLGEIVEIGPRQSVINTPAHPYTRKLMKAVPVPDPERRAMRRGLSLTEIPSPLRPVGFVPPVRQWRDLGGGHLVMDADPTA